MGTGATCPGLTTAMLPTRCPGRPEAPVQFRRCRRQCPSPSCSAPRSDTAASVCLSPAAASRIVLSVHQQDIPLQRQPWIRRALHCLARGDSTGSASRATQRYVAQQVRMNTDGRCQSCQMDLDLNTLQCLIAKSWPTRWHDDC